MYDVSFDHDTQLLAIRWHRIFTPDEVVTYTRDVMRQFLAAHFRPGYCLLIDMSACGPQPQETLAALAQHMGRSRRRAASRSSRSAPCCARRCAAS